ncbi:HEAT repeat domain-containing protein [Actinomadura gamaensis]|uniref:HEAT repeat domain-containing protein n=1 Tax=Actinomadura gamaensis TaxID=1763541 RepID=A0ABV9TVC3_9ACTN
MAVNRNRFVLKREFSRSDVKFVAWERNWRLVDLERENNGCYVDIWTTQDEQTEIHLVDDRPIGMRYLTVWGRDVGAVEREIREDCKLWSLPEALESLRQANDRNEKLISVYAAALTAPFEESQELLEAFRAVAHDDDAGVRQAVVIAIGHLPLPGLVEIVRERSENDPVAHVRENAKTLLEGIRLYGDE